MATAPNAFTFFYGTKARGSILFCREFQNRSDHFFTVTEAQTKKQRVWIDCTDTYRRGTRTGIQRVVRNLVTHGQRVDDTCRPVIFGGAASTSQRWHAIEWDPAKDGLGTPRHGTRLTAPRPRGVADALKSFALRTFRAVRSALKPLRVVELAIDWMRRRRLDASYRAVDWQPGDILLLPDVMWTCRTKPDYAALRARGVRIVLCIYDLIPIEFPEFVHPMSAQWFEKWLEETVPQMDGIVTISRTVRDTVRKYVAGQFPEVGLSAERIEWFPMGVALDEARETGAVRDAIRAAAGAYLTVSTLEPRKNQRLLIDAFEQVWRRFPEASLCIVGQEGWLVDELVARIRLHPRLGRQLFWFDDLTDTELAWMYAHAKALVFPSLTEGFGLPMVEALLHRLPVVASDTPIHREVAGEFAVYFDPLRADALAALIERWEAGEPVKAARDPADYRTVTWDESTTAVLARCRELASRDSTGALR